MNKYQKVCYLIAIIYLAWSQTLFAQENKGSQSVNIPADQIIFNDIGGPHMGAIWGDSSKSAHGSFLRLPGDFVSPVHLHTGDYYGVIVEGTVTNSEAGQPEIQMPPGSYYFQKANTDHVTKCLSKTGCLIYISQSEAFDFITRDSE